MENHGLLGRRSWSPVRKAQVAGALAGAVITVATFLAALVAADHGSRFLGLDMMVPMSVCFGPAGWLIHPLGLPVNYWGAGLFLPGRSGMIFATLLNAVLLSSVGAVLGWLWRKVCMPKSN